MLLACQLFSQVRNTFGLLRTYKGVPTSIPNLPNSESFIPTYTHPTPYREPKTIEEIIDPYPNFTSFLFDHHFWTSGPTKSRRNRNSTQALLTRKDFKSSDLEGVNFNAIEQELQGYSSTGRWEQTRGWRKSDLVIRFPLGVKKTEEVHRAKAAQAARLHRGAPEPPPSTAAPVEGYPLLIPDFYHRSICEVIRETFSQDPAACNFHYHPLVETYHSPANPTLPAKRIYSEVFTSDAWIEEDAKIQMTCIDPSKPEQDLPRVVAAIMLWSDKTVLNLFGQNKAWPVYIFFGNQPKSERVQPTASGGCHLAYLPQVVFPFCC